MHSGKLKFLESINHIYPLKESNESIKQENNFTVLRSAHLFLYCTPHRVVANHSDPQFGNTSKVSTQGNQDVRKSNYLCASKIIKLEKKKKKENSTFSFSMRRIQHGEEGAYFSRLFID